MAVIFRSCLYVTVFCYCYGLPNFTRREGTSLDLVSREDWGALTSTDLRPLLTPVQYVIIHHTYIPGACYSRKECSEAMRSMQNYHNSLEWGDIGYNFCIGSDGAAYEGRGWEKKGIHAGRANGVSVGLCLIGDWREELPPQTQLNTTKSLIKQGIELGYIREDYKLVGHNQIMHTECPGTALGNEIKTWDHFLPMGPDDPLVTAKKNN